MTAIALSRPVYYPESDGRPMAETQVHAQVMLDLFHTLGRRYADVPDVYAWGNMMFYYVEGNPKASVAPDVFLVHGVDKRVRRTYKLWEERTPSLVVEITSESTKSEDMKVKKGLYERLGIEEYFLFDPLGEYLRPRLQGYRLVNGRYEPLAAEGDGALLSRTTGLRLEPEGDRLRLRDAATGKPLLWADEEARAREAAEENTEQERLARLAAEEEVRRLREEILRLRESR
jgi:Uma2 family endonuclease